MNKSCALIFCRNEFRDYLIPFMEMRLYLTRFASVSAHSFEFGSAFIFIFRTYKFNIHIFPCLTKTKRIPFFVVDVDVDCASEMRAQARFPCDCCR